MEHLQSRMDYAAQLFRTAEYEEAKIILTALLRNYKKHGVTKEIHLCLYRLAYIAYIRGEMRNFRQLFAQYETTILDTEDMQLNIEYAVLVGLYELSFQHYEQAIDTFTHVTSLANDARFMKQKVLAQLYMQNCYILMERFEHSLAISNQVWQLYQDIIQPDTGHYFHYVLNRADTMFALGQLIETDQLLVQCEQHPDYAIMPIDRIKALVLRAKLHLATDAPHTAIIILKNALALATQQEDVNLLSNVYETLVTNYEALGKPNEALVYAKKRLALHKMLVINS